MQEAEQAGKLERSYQRLQHHKELISQAQLELEEMGGRYMHLEVDYLHSSPSKRVAKKQRSVPSPFEPLTARRRRTSSCRA